VKNLIDHGSQLALRPEMRLTPAATEADRRLCSGAAMHNDNRKDTALFFRTRDYKPPAIGMCSDFSGMPPDVPGHASDRLLAGVINTPNFYGTPVVSIEREGVRRVPASIRMAGENFAYK
jgi:hypothetical protein